MAQIILTVLLISDLLLSLLLHGQQTRINFWVKLIDALLLVALLIAGGFFK